MNATNGTTTAAAALLGSMIDSACKTASELHASTAPVVTPSFFARVASVASATIDTIASAVVSTVKRVISSATFMACSVAALIVTASVASAVAASVVASYSVPFLISIVYYLLGYVISYYVTYAALVCGLWLVYAVLIPFYPTIIMLAIVYAIVVW